VVDEVSLWPRRRGVLIRTGAFSEEENMPGCIPIRQELRIAQLNARDRRHPAAAYRNECSEYGLAQSETIEVVVFGHIVVRLGSSGCGVAKAMKPKNGGSVRKRTKPTQNTLSNRHNRAKSARIVCTKSRSLHFIFLRTRTTLDRVT